MKQYIGRVSPYFRGEWSSVLHYDYLDVVYYKGESYVNVFQNNWNIPPNTTMKGYWLKIAKRGGDGINYEWLNTDTFKDF